MTSAEEAEGFAKEPTLGDIPPSLRELFDRDPLSLTRPDINAIVAELRQQRQNFVSAEAESKTKGTRLNTRKAVRGEKSSVPLDIDKLMDEI